MGVKKKPTLKILFRQFAISLIVMLVAAIIVPSGLEGLAVNAGLATRANLSELQVKEIIPTLTIAPDITKVMIPQGCGYLILDKNFNELYSNMDDDEKEIALLYAKGEYIEYAAGEAVCTCCPGKRILRFKVLYWFSIYSVMATGIFSIS